MNARILLPMALGALLGGAPCAAAGEVRIADESCSLRFEEGRLVVADRSGTDILAIGQVPFVWSKPCAVPSSAKLTRNGRIRVAYAATDAGTNFPFAAEASLTGHGFAVDFAARIPSGVRSGGQMVEVFRLNGTRRDSQVTKCGYWRRCRPAEADGYREPGVPFEVGSMKLKPYRAASGQVFWCRNTGWAGANTECPGFPRQAVDGIYRARLEFVTGVDSSDAQVAAAQADGRPLVMALTTDRPFNLFERGAPAFRLTVKPLVRRRCTLHTVARDFDGRIALERREAVALVPGQPLVRDYALPSVKAGERGIWFVESAVLDGESELGFCRLNTAVLPPHRFAHRSGSIAAMAAYPETDDAFRLMERLGVSILRYGDNHYFTTNFGMTAYCSRQAPEEVFDPANPRHVKILEEEIVGRIRRCGNPYLEFGNEIGWHRTEAEQTQLMKSYASWLRAIRARLRDAGLSQVKIITFGIQPDYSAHMLQVMKETGVLDLVDGLTLHPGRGYYTADCIHGGWVYRGIIRRARKRFAELGYPDREIHMTECYAATHPNDGWKDSPRQAAESVLLSLVIAAAEPQVRNMMFYKLHQGTSQDPHGYPKAHANGLTTENAEYDFGLLMRDDSPKPSLLAYAATCEHLDGARFLRERGEGAGEPASLRCFAFETPRGKLAVLFDRNEGCQYLKLAAREFPKGRAKDQSLFRHKDPWRRHWHESRRYSFRTAGPVRVFDLIGRERPVRVKGGRLELELDGEPVFVYGLDLADVFAGSGTGAADSREPSADEYADEERSGGLLK